MAVNTKRVFYVDRVAATNFLDILATREDIRVDRLENDAAAPEAGPVLEAAHAFQIGSARDELDPGFHAHAGLLARAPNLLVISTNGAGYDTVDLDDCTKAGVLVVNQAGGNKEAVAEHALAMMLCLAKRIIETDRFMRRSDGIERNAYMGTELKDKTLGIIGLGHVGGRLAELCRVLFNMRVLAYDPYLSAEQIAAKGATKSGLDEMLTQADYVSINCPRTAETLNLMNARTFGLMQKHAYFVTTARGGIHDEAALYEALRTQSIAGAGLDVWFKEPPPKDHPLMQFDNVLVSPHTAGVTRESRANIARIAAEQMLDILDGKPASRVLNPAVWPAFAARFEATFGFAPSAPQG
ncbi:MAG: hydroxyacid dehydrogenase [Alphaproteobacteria bacterium]|nr:hydroxyacid dehydrogenase [Alphaproteobacteria bacterium]